MKYGPALEQAWSGLEKQTREKQHTLRFLNDEYSIDLKQRSILSLSCGVPAKIHYAILILHYLTQKLKGLPEIKED